MSLLLCVLIAGQEATSIEGKGGRSGHDERLIRRERLVNVSLLRAQVESTSDDPSPERWICPCMVRKDVGSTVSRVDLGQGCTRQLRVSK